ncbi:MAG: hypothetical protein B7C24_11430 [Bacteroidetes bacterium 4572_77]|nr:MAG: hypothetical protein B7C24_11430 [Bacteroidetes bacterium 4572_77]
MKKHILLGAILFISSIVLAQNIKTINHHLQVKINPEMAEIWVVDSMIIGQETNQEFLLNAAFTPVSLTKNMKLTKIENNANASDVGMDRDDAEQEDNLQLSRWEIKGKADYIVIQYEGKIAAALKQSKENYQRGFAQSPGIIDALGVYLAGSTFWVPVFDDHLMIYSLNTELPASWRNVSQGERTYEETQGEKHLDTWVCDKPQEEVFLIAAQFNEYTHDMNSGVKAMAFLRTPDEALANKYLEVTEQYMEMYVSMLGDYPYSKFALVENFWETGYGMPSFTLLGEKIIRFPFILHSSYPHELLHNWWGNSVYVDFESGNWCEGTTVFMADHLIKEQRGAGEEYRRSTLQKYSNFVNADNDFPLSEFLSRHDGPSEAIGYGKSMMLWQMLRRQLGDETFLAGMKLFYEQNIYRTASYADIRKAMEEVSGTNLEAFFTQWVTRTGAPEIGIKEISQDKYNNQYRINITLEQVQNSPAFDLNIPIHVATKSGTQAFVFQMNTKEQSYQLNLKEKPLKLVVDPQYDVFRILNPAEVPPTLSHIWASDNNIIVLPWDAPQKDMYKQFAQQWKDTDNDNFEIVWDKDLKESPQETTAWIIGFENKFAPQIQQYLEEYNSGFNTDSLHFEKKDIIKQQHSFVATFSKKNDINKQDIWIAFDNPKAIDGLIRKLPHYGKYSYLAFQGDEPTNMAKGQWPLLSSPLIKVFDESGRKISVKEKRSALATLKPVFSEQRMMKSVEYLASEELKGRGIATPEIDKAAAYIAQQFKDAGLQAINKDSYYQEFEHRFDEKGLMQLKNVIGVIPGNDPVLKNETVVISAHYDHLGLGWPDVHKGDEGKIHYGADDNASGVATIIELARNMAKSTKPKRTIVFLACTAEEAGLIGSRYYVKHSKDYFSGEIFANINIDTDGSLFDKKLMVLNGNTAREWKFIFMGTDYTTGVKSEVITQDLDASDQIAFIEQGIPAVQLFTGPTANYHRPSDTYDKIDGKGLVKVATVTKEVLLYLADREDPMPFTGKSAKARTAKPSNAAPAKKANRRVSTGSVPDFAFGGPGVKISSVVPGSAGEKAGLLKGDIILALDGEKAENLKAYSDLLKKYQPEEVVKVKILRGEKEMLIELTLGER